MSRLDALKSRGFDTSTTPNSTRLLLRSSSEAERRASGAGSEYSEPSANSTPKRGEPLPTTTFGKPKSCPITPRFGRDLVPLESLSRVRSTTQLRAILRTPGPRINSWVLRAIDGSARPDTTPTSRAVSYNWTRFGVSGPTIQPSVTAHACRATRSRSFGSWPPHLSRRTSRSDPSP